MIPDVSIYGHMTIDTIFDDEKKYEFGGIANVWRTIKKTYPDILINLEPIHYGEAVIYIDKSNSKRYSDAVLNIRTFEPKVMKSNVNHILYINELDDASFVNSIKGFNIADTCKGKELSKFYLENIDILLSSDEDEEIVREAVENFNGIFILHNSRGCKITYLEHSFSFTLDKKYFLSHVNVLGAGDIYAAFLIYEIYKSEIYKLDDKYEIYKRLTETVEGIHIKTSTYISDINKGKLI